MQSQEITKVIRLYPLGTMNVCTKINCNPSNSYELSRYFSVNDKPTNAANQQAMMLLELKTEIDISEKKHRLVNEIQDIF